MIALTLLSLAALALPADHSHEPWVFRSVLDDQARMLTVALDDELWLAYDATDGSLYRAWKGGVNFDGAVYTTVHGPQPTSANAGYLGTHAVGWWLTDETGDVPGTPIYRGYRTDGDRFRLQLGLRFEDGTVVEVIETPHVKVVGDTVQLIRNLEATGVPSTSELSMRVSLGFDGRTAMSIEAGATRFTWGAEEVTRRIDRRVPFQAGNLQLSSMHRIVELVPESAVPKDSLVPEAPPAEPLGVAPGEIHVELIEGGDDSFGPRERGLSMRIFDVGVGMSEIPALVDRQTPNVNAIIPRVELFDLHSFGGLDDTFVTQLFGYLETGAGSYDFRLSSDDGSRMTLDGELLIDNDGLHGHQGVEASIELEARLHEFEIWHFENSGGQSVVLEWRTPGSEEFVVVPDEAFSCAAGEVRVTSPGDKEVLVDRTGKAGDGRPLEDVHPSFSLSTVRPADFEPKVGGMDWTSDGRLVVCTWDPSGSVYVLDGAQSGNADEVRVKRIASGLAEPLGLNVVDDRIYVLQKQELTELIDHDGDGVTDEYRCVSSGWDVTANFHEFAFGLVYLDGFFFANLAIAIDPGGASSKNQVLDRGTTIRINPEDGNFEVIAQGLRTPNGIGLGAEDAIFMTDNQGDWLPVSKLLKLHDGAFYNSRAVLLDASNELEVTPPVAWLPQNEIGNSPGEPALVPEGNGPYSGQMIHGDVTHGGVKRVFIEEVDGVQQGVVFRFTQGLEAGINRLSWGPDGALYVGGIGSTGNWGHEGKLHYGLQRLKYNGEPAFEMLAVRAQVNGFEVEFTEPLHSDWGFDPLAWEIQQWRYEPTAEYGGAKLDETDLEVRAVVRSEDGRRIHIELNGLLPEHVVYLRVRQPFVSETGRELWSTEAWYTLNRIPNESFFTLRESHNQLSEAERAEGWQLLFDGESLDAWTPFKSGTVSDGWQARYGELARVGSAGDLVTRETFRDFELSLEWRLSHKGNSGIFFNVTDDHNYVWESGPEMQILDNDGHGDGITELTSAGANYALHPPVRDVTRPLGQFNHARLRVKDGKVEHWLNDVKLLEYELGTDEWKALVEASKFASMPDYGLAREGRIALQDHGDPVFFRNIKIRRL